MIIRRMCVRGIAASLAIVGYPACAALAPFHAVYQANYMGVQAQGEMTLVAEQAKQWKYTFEIKNPLASIVQITRFKEESDQFTPIESDDTSAWLVKRRNIKAVYDWKSKQAYWKGDIKSSRQGPVALQDGDMDGLLINLALVRDVTANRPLNYRLVDDGRAKDMRYSIAGKETVTVEGKQQEATKVVEKDNNKEIIAWVVPGVPVPVHLLQKVDGKDNLELTLSTFHSP